MRLSLQQAMPLLLRQQCMDLAGPLGSLCSQGVTL
jgi:hypothetical protein